MTHDQLTQRRTQLLEQLREHTIACEQLKGALSLLEELLAAPGPDPHAEHIPELDGKPADG